MLAALNKDTKSTLFLPKKIHTVKIMKYKSDLVIRSNSTSQSVLLNSLATKKALVSIINKVVMTIIAIGVMMDPLLELSKRSLGTLRYILIFAVHGRDMLDSREGCWCNEIIFVLLVIHLTSSTASLSACVKVLLHSIFVVYPYPR